MLTKPRFETGSNTNPAPLPPHKIKAITAELAALITKTALTSQTLSAAMTRHLGGTDASGVWDWRLAFDLMQVAAGQGAKITPGTPQQVLAQLGDLMASLPTETRRSERQVQLQQFSTPLDLAFIVAQAARITTSDLVLEPSAGTGALAVMARMLGADLVLNEIDGTRRALLAATTGVAVTGHDAEFIDDLARFRRAPSVVLMNPPFASSVTRNDPTIAQRHVLSALKSLRPGGRLVAIVPPSVSVRGDAGLWARICAMATPVLRLHLPRRAFARMGTSVPTDLLVLDRHGPDPVAVANTPVPHCPDHLCPDLAAALSILDTHCPPRLPLSSSQQFGRKQSGPRVAPDDAKSAATPAARRSAKRNGATMLLPGADTKARNSIVPLEVDLLEVPRVNLPISDIYASYAPQRLTIAGAVSHPSPLVESLAMGSVHPPQPGGMPIRLPGRIVKTGALSEAQLETILMAETAFGSDLPGRFCMDEKGHLVRKDAHLSGFRESPAEAVDDDAQAYRRGYFLGDGTGCGKGRQVAGLILAGWLQGRRKAIWLSKSSTLIEDSIRDWSDLGGARTDIHALSKWKPDEAINLASGILFVTYATLRAVSQSGARRLDQILDWLGTDFDGVIGFDEAHAMQNAGGGTANRGTKSPSQQGLAGLRLQNALPRARCLYVSATGATEVANLAYATRLGLWGAGPDYAFASRDDFVTRMEAGGVAAMEVVARDLKALGLYTARALSFEGVDYDILEHQLTSDQVALYDTYASAFKVIHQNLHAALEATGISAGGGENAAKAAGAARSAAISAFESTKQRLFNHLLQGLKCATVIEAMRRDIAEGWAPVVQIVSTGEALLKRRLETLGPEDELTEGALTPREYVVTYLERAFPVTQQVLVEQEDGTVLSEPLRDAHGHLVISREAEALRQAALEEIMLLAGVPSALDQIVWAFGPDAVAEVTGRSVRPLKDDTGANGHSGVDGHSAACVQAGALRIERRSASANAAETSAFMEGSKSILIFSDAGGTGRSYHAAGAAQNQKRRRHYLLEPGWRADAAIQGLGRTHRAAQVNAPFFRVCTSDVHGEKRFTSTIARRLDTLGALTKGQRETASQGMFRASDNLESPIARACLRSLYGDLVRGEALTAGTTPSAGSADTISLEVFCDWTGLKLVNREGQMLEELPPIQRFLNRVLALPIAMQNRLFAALMEKIDLATERAVAAGRLDVGLETLRGDRITAGAAQELRRCASTGAVTSLVPLKVEQHRSYPGAEAVLAEYPSLTPMRNTASGAVALISPRPREVYEENGDVSFERRIIRPDWHWRGRACLHARESGSFITEARFARSNWEAVDATPFRRLWDAQVADLPKMEVTELHLLTGLILPIWKSIPGQNTRIYRAQPETGPALLGRALTDDQAATLRGRFMDLAAATPSELLAVVTDTDRAVDPGAGLSLKRRRVAGHWRLELTGAETSDLAWLKSLGCFTEIHQYQLRLFLPMEAEVALRIVTAIVGHSAGSTAASVRPVAEE